MHLEVPFLLRNCRIRNTVSIHFSSTALAIRLRKYFYLLLLDGLTNWPTSTAHFTQLSYADKRHVSRLPALQPSWNVRTVNGKCLADKDDSAPEPLSLWCSMACSCHPIADP